VRVVPDRIEISLGAETFDASLEKAVAKNTDAGRRLLAAFHALGLSDRDIRTDALTLSIVYVDSSHPAKGIEGYFANRVYRIVTKDGNLVERIIASALQNGANRIFDIEYGVLNKRTHRDEARRLATQAAREKAQLFATGFGMKVGMPRTISETSTERWYGYAANQNVITHAGAGESPSFAAGELTIAAQVSVTFDLIPGDPFPR
jgi:uncharacterized protein